MDPESSDIPGAQSATAHESSALGQSPHTRAPAPPLAPFEVLHLAFARRAQLQLYSSAMSRQRYGRGGSGDLPSDGDNGSSSEGDDAGSIMVRAA